MITPAHRPVLRTRLLVSGLVATSLACGGADGPGPNGEPPNVPGTELWIDVGDGLDHGLMTTLELSTKEDMQIERTLSEVIAVEGIFEDGATVALNDLVEWSTDEPDVIRLTASPDGAELEALAEGTATVFARIGTLEASRSVTVIPPALVEIRVEASGPFDLAAIVDLTATGVYRDDSTQDITDRVTWSSSDPDLVRVFDDEGRKGITLIRGRTDGVPVTLTAALEGVAGTLDVDVPCGLEPSDRIALDEVMPNAAWANAVVYDEAGNRTERALSVRDMMCDPAFDGYRAFAFSLNAGWCGPCHLWMRTAAQGEADLAAAGILPIFVVGETTVRGAPGQAGATTDYAEMLATTHAGDAMSIRIGDAETMGAGPSGIKQILGTTGAWPSLFVVGREDMRVHSLAPGAPPNVSGLIRIADEIPAGGGGGDTPVMSDCTDGAEEATEPNDFPKIAPLVELGTMAGGICNPEPDFYRVEVEGPWRATLMFDNGTADLDIYAWDETTNAILQVDGQGVFSAGNRADVETIELNGPAMLRIQAKRQGDTADYSLVIEPI